jgi:dihydrofolate synthase / folylpolyglutamate synthase
MLCLEYFYEKKVDIAVMECGLGGLLDATNIITPLLSMVATIG